MPTWFFSRRKNSSGFSDEELAEYFFRTRSRKAMTELFSGYAHLLFGVCMKYLSDEEKAKDAVMQVFEKVLSYTPEKSIENFKGWLYTVTRNHCLMQIRKEQAQNRYLNQKEKELSDEIMENPLIETLLNEEELNRKFQNLQSAIDGLSKDQKICIDLFYLQEKTYEEIMKLTGFTFNEVKSHIQNGKRNLKIHMGYGR